MNNLSHYEQDIILESEVVSREFNIYEFLQALNTKGYISVSHFNVRIKLIKYSEIINNAYNSISNFSLSNADISEMTNFFKENSIDNLPISSHNFLIEEVGRINPNYLTQYLQILATKISNVTSGKLSNESRESIKAYVNMTLSGRAALNLKKQVVDTTLPYNSSIKNLNKELPNIPVDDSFIDKNVMPFLNSHNNMISAISKEVNTATSVLNHIELYSHTIINTVNDYLNTEDNIRKKKYVMELLYNGISALLDASSFMSFLLVRKIANIADATIEVRKIYNSAIPDRSLMAIESGLRFDTEISFNPEFDKETEPTGGSYDSGWDSRNRIFGGENLTLYNLCRQRLDYYVNLVNTHSNLTITEILEKINSYPSSYKISTKLVCDFIYKLTPIILSLKSTEIDGNSVLRDSTKKIPDMNRILKLKKDTENARSIFGFNNYKIIKLIQILRELSESIFRVGDILSDLEDALSPIEIINIETMNKEYYSELSMFINEYRGNEFVAICNIALNTMYLDMCAVCDALDDKFGLNPTNNNLVIDDRDYDTTDITFKYLLVESEHLTDVIFENLNLEYYKLRNKKERGIDVVFEDEANANTSTNNTATQNTSNNTSNNSTNNTQTQTQTNNTQDNSNKPGGKKVDAIMADIQKWFQSVTKRLDDIVRQFQAKNNDKYFTDNKTGLLERNYSNLSNKTPIINYEKLMPYATLTKDMNLLVNKTTTTFLTPQKLQSLNDNSAIRKQIFSFIPEKVWKDYDGDTLPKGKAITNYYKNGTYDENRVTLKNAELKALVESAVEYCTTFFDKIYPALRNDMEKISNNLSSSVKTLVTEGTTDIINKLVLFEEENAAQTNNNQGNNQSNSTTTANTSSQPAPNTITNMTSKVKEIEMLVQTYCNGIITAAFDRYKDYFALCTSIIPRDGGTNTEDTQTNTTTNNTQQPSQENQNTQNNQPTA